MRPLKEAFLALSDEQLDHSMFPLLRKWDDEPTPIQILEVLDHCINGALASGFIVKALQLLYSGACEREKTPHEEVVKLATWRGSNG